MAADISMPLAIDEIVIPEGRRPIDLGTVKRLADSIEQIGLKHPITVRRKGDQYILIAGLHRLEACRKIGREHVPAIICTMTNAEARMWEIAENLHRAELTKLERAEYIEEWRGLVLQNATPSQPAERGVRKTAEALGVDPAEIIRAEKIARITPEAKEAARELGLDDNQSKLLEIAREAPQDQMSKVHELVSPKTWDEVEAEQKRKLMLVWNGCSPTVKTWFRETVDTPIMDRQFA